MKLSKIVNASIIVILGLIVGYVSGYLVLTASFYNVAQTNSWMQATELPLSLPVAIMDPYSSPSSAFVIESVFWIIIFYLLAKICSKFFKGKYSFFKHSVSILIVVLLVSPYIFYSFGTNEINACLSGKLDYTFHPGQLGGMQLPDSLVGPVDCFRDAVNKDLGPKANDTTAIADYCGKLSDRAIVDDGKNGYNLSYRAYCKANLQHESMSLDSAVVKIGQPLTIHVTGLQHTGYTYIMLEQQVPNVGTIGYGLWNGLIPENNTILIALPEKACSDRMESISGCKFSLRPLTPGDYILHLEKPDPNHNIDLTSNLRIIQ